MAAVQLQISDYDTFSKVDYEEIFVQIKAKSARIDGRVRTST
jgi:hypothetical protein